MKSKTIQIQTLLLILLPAQAFADSKSYDLTEGRKGAIIPTEEELRPLHGRKVRRVKPNRLALDRANQERAEHGLPPLNIDAAKPSEELEVEILGTHTSSTPDETTVNTSANRATAIPTQVDNSKLAAFPPIGDQGNEASCNTWATGYYQTSHETCLVRGCDNKTSATFRASPRWIYNMINGGTDGGSNITHAFNVLTKNGYVSLNSLPYVAGDYRKWDLSPSHWIDALSLRALSTQTFGNLDTASGLDAVKQTLANGHVLVYGTYVSSWVKGTVGAKPATLSPFAGQPILTYVNGTSGAHVMTIVGYDDSVWVDLNRNGVADTGESGAFKVANSWGSSWGVNGYLWISYDAMGLTTQVAGGPASSTRGPAFFSKAAYGLSARASYSPRLIAQFAVNTSNRGQMQIQVGASASTATAPSSILSSGAFLNQGGAYAFNGSTTPVDGTFALDLSDLISANGSPQKFYLIAKDSTIGSPLSLNSYQLIDLPNNRTISYSSNVGTIATLDASAKTLDIAYDPLSFDQAPVAVIKATSTSSNSGTQVSFDGTGSYDPDGTIATYTWNFGDGSNLVQGAAASHLYPIVGSYTATLVVTDQFGHKAQSSYTVKVTDTQAPATPTSFTARLGLIKTVVILGWKASSDNVGVTGYSIYRNGAKIAQVSATSYQDTGTVTGAGTYTYSVLAYDAAGNLSLLSNTASVIR